VLQQSRILWNSPPADLTLSSNDVHVWRTSLEQPPSRVEQLRQILSADEQTRAERFYFEQHKNRFIVARGTLRIILSGYLNISPSQVEFCYGTRGKPGLAATLGKGMLEFNLSHSQDIALYAVTRDRPIGVDIEHIRPMPDAEKIAERFFAVRENAALLALPASLRQQAFFNCWTRKEAYLKACGDGLAGELNKIEVSLTPGEPAQLLSIAGDAEAAARWCLKELILYSPVASFCQTISPADYAAALAVEGHGTHLHCWAFRD
jgi:4'-phosphopantetheinyl transferase